MGEVATLCGGAVQPLQRACISPLVLGPPPPPPCVLEPSGESGCSSAWWRSGSGLGLGLGLGLGFEGLLLGLEAGLHLLPLTTSYILLPTYDFLRTTYYFPPRGRPASPA